MNSFISDVLQNLIDKGEDLSDLSFILPSKRAGVFLRQELSVVVNKTIFSPKIISIEEFVENEKVTEEVIDKKKPKEEVKFPVK